MDPEILVYVPPVPGAVRTVTKAHRGSVLPAIFTDGNRNPFIGAAVEGTTISLYGLLPAMLEDMEKLRILGTRTLRLMSAILAKGNPLDAEIVRECWIASNLQPSLGPCGNAERLANARDIVRTHLGQDVATYLRDQERYAS